MLLFGGLLSFNLERLRPRLSFFGSSCLLLRAVTFVERSLLSLTVFRELDLSSDRLRLSDRRFSGSSRCADIFVLIIFCLEGLLLAFSSGKRSSLLLRDRDRQLLATRCRFSDSGLLLDLLCSMLVSLERARFLELDLLSGRRRPRSSSTDGTRFASQRSDDRCRSLLSTER